MKLRPYNDPDYRRARALLTSEKGKLQCWHPTCNNLATSIDHVPPLMHHTHVRGTGCCQLRPSCARCNYSHGATIGNQQRTRTSGWA